MSAAFRVYYQLATLQGVRPVIAEVNAETPDAARKQVAAANAPRIPLITKVKRLAAAKEVK